MHNADLRAPRRPIMHRPIPLPEDHFYNGPFCLECGDLWDFHAPWWRRLLRRIGSRILP